MSTLPFTLLCIGIMLSGGLIGVFLHIITKKQKENIPESFCESNVVYLKFTDQNDVSIDEVAKKFELLDI